MSSQPARSKGMPKRSAAPPPKPSRTPWLIGCAVIAVIAVAAIIALGVSSWSSGLQEPADAAITVSGEALPELTAGATDAAIGLTIPTLMGTDLEDAPMTMGPDGGPMAIVILAHWCPHCQAEVPLIVDYLSSTGMPEGVSIVGLSTSITQTAENYPPSEWLEREGWTPQTLNDDANSTALTTLGVGNFPGFVFVDADGRVVQRLTGEIPVSTFDEIVSSLAP